MRYDVLLSDADGTLFDFLAGERNAILWLFREFGLPTDADTVRIYSEINEGHWKKLERRETTQEKLRVERFVDFLEALGLSGDARSMSELYVEKLGQQRILLPGAEELCRTVSAQMPIYLVTNGIGRVQRSRFEDCALSPYLSGIVISEEIGHAKPEPHMLLEAMRLAGISDPRRAVMLGDSVTADMAAAKNAGVDAILFTDGEEAPAGHGARYVVKTLQEAEKVILGEG